ncbi:SUMO protein smt3 [Spiromyces aspiralis]|uniref:SUMO protein smt3 n=1 Tax=Spiromyces aspiralis TaxID=68401 RepID=A0ACC1HGV8_9FUNG|nr:SUMO protein smt3 [Spiromyces aspiralis]
MSEQEDNPAGTLIPPTNTSVQDQKPQEPVKDEKLTPSSHINLRVVSPDNQEICFKIKRSTRLEKLMNAYLERTNRAKGSIRFIFDGQRINPNDTPEDLEMEENDAIDAMVEQLGGSSL